LAHKVLLRNTGRDLGSSLFRVGGTHAVVECWGNACRPSAGLARGRIWSEGIWGRRGFAHNARSGMALERTDRSL